jgi:4-hydroxythreonine-4-phosphate dehydrogenase
MSRQPKLAITMGDPAGIGPEICLAVCGMPVVRKAAQLTLVGTRSILERTARELRLPEDWSAAKDDEPIRVVDVGEASDAVRWGHLSPQAGRLSAQYLDRAIDMALAGEVDAIVTAPISKEAWHRAGVRHPGHTEYLAERLGADEYAMMLVHDAWRVLHLSTHCSLRGAIALVEKERIVRMLRLFDNVLRELGIASPSIAVAGLNPHAGEGGLFGDEEITEIAPAVEQARLAGMRVVGPISPDTVFARARTGEFDGVLAMYHDQGHVAVKTVAFEPGPSGRWASVHGVNVTVGLPIIRTSVDHGVAFDIAGQGIARPDSLVDAVLLAAQMARNRIQKRGAGA